MEKIDITISKDAQIEYQVNGVKGKKCKELTKAIDQIASGVISTEVTGEYCQVDPEERVHTRGD